MNSPFELLTWQTVSALNPTKPRTYQSVGSLDERIYQEAWDSLESWMLNLQDYRVLKDYRFFGEGGRRLKELAKAIERCGRQDLIFKREECLQVTDESLRFLVESLQHACFRRTSREMGKLLRAAYRANLELTDEKVLELRILLAQLEENDRKPADRSPPRPLPR